uniref:Lipoprotein n=1 Tax=Arundo donax TaxID=35708 RepID=A0A0A9FM53_ARUDO
MNTIYKSFFCSMYLSISCRTKKITFMVDLLGMKPN